MQGIPRVAIQCYAVAQWSSRATFLLPVLAWLRNAVCLVNKVMK